MAANRRSRKVRRISSKEFILSFFTFFFNSCFGCSQQPPPEAEVEEEEEELNSSTDKTTNAEKSAAAVKYGISRSTAPVPIIGRSAPPRVVGSIKRRVNYDKKEFEKRTSGGGDEINSIIGALIVSVTLVVMLIWGKLCAVICAALWLYFVPRFRAEDRNGFYEFDRMKTVSKNAEIIDSPEYKRRVVFEGFLERNHRVRI